MTAIRTEAKPECFLCGATGELLFSDLGDRLYAVPGVWSLRRCSAPDCGWVWLDPVPVAEDMQLLYRNYFTHGPEPASASRRMFEGLYRALNLLPSQLLGLARARSRIETMYLGDLAPGKLLDVGCGDGQFLLRMRRRGWATQGIDFDSQAVERAKAVHDLDVSVGLLEEVTFLDDSFDAVTASHVVEHVLDPIEFLRECFRLVRPGGRVVVVTPNLDSLGFRRHQAAWMGLDPPRHLNLFDLKNLERCARRAGASSARVFSTAANAETLFAVSLGIEAKGSHSVGRPTSLELLRPLTAVAWQYREHLGLSSKPDQGEEALLIMQK